MARSWSIVVATLCSWVVGIGSAGLALGACKAYDPSLVLDGGQDSGLRANCVLRRPPPRVELPSDGVEQEVVFGLRNLLINQTGGLWASVGYDLDGECTEPPGSPQPCMPLGTSSPQLDGFGGIDNTTGATIFPLIEANFPGLQQRARDSQDVGIGAPVFRVEGWNGSREDSRVQASILQTVFVAGATAEGRAPEIAEVVDFQGVMANGDLVAPPRWDGTDYAWLRDDGFLGGQIDRPLVSDENAYISDGTLVIQIPQRIELGFPAGDTFIVVRLTGGVATGRFSEDLQNLDVTIAGRFSIVDILYTANFVGLCEGSPNYDLLFNLLESLADVRSDPSSDSAGLPCNALSTAITLRGYRVQLGGVTPGPGVVDECANPGDAGPGDAGPGDAGSGDAGSGDSTDAGPADAGPTPG